MSKLLAIRFFYLLVLIAAAIWLPAWVFVGFALIVLSQQSHFYEVLLPAIIFDALAGAPDATWFGFQYVATAGFLVAVYLVEELKEHLHFYYRR